MSEPVPHYDPNEPAHPQENDWDCSCESTEWALFAYGRTPDDDWIEQSMIAAGVANPAVGLTDASGAGLANWLNVEYGEFGYVSSNEPSVSFDDVAAEAATLKHPLLMGGRAWCHWTGVRGYSAADDLLLLANPANGYQGVYQTMNRSQFASLGSFSMVRLTHPEAEGASGTETPPPTDGPPASTELPIGYDVASHQGYPNWAAVAGSGAAFAITKATESVDYLNPTFAYNWSGIKAAGLTRGAYHFARPDCSGPENEAAWFYHIVGPLLEPGDLLALDLEDYNGSLSSRPSEVAGWALRFLRYLEQLAGYKPLLYVSPSVISEYGLTDPAFGEYGLWLAAWGASFPPTPAPWPVIAFWQSGDDGRVAGINGAVDVDRFNGPAASIPLYGKPEAATPPDPEPEPPTTDADKDAQIAALQAEVDRLNAEVARLNSVLGYASHDIADALQKESDQINLSNGAIVAAITTLRSLHP
jgi:GH25 family lysozyme M1 (1,4-beta-N-acetylmuramidase)